MSGAAVSTIDPKHLATLKAKAALRGVVLYFTEGDRGEPLFIASRWSLTRQMHSIDEVEDFLARIGDAS